MSKNRKKLKDTAVGKFLAGAGSNIIGSLGDVLPDKGVMGLVKNLIKKDPELPAEDKIASIDTGTKKIISNSISGITVRNLNPEDKKNYKVSYGVLVSSIDESINNNYDLKLNDVITKVNNKVIKNAQDFSKIMKSEKDNSYVNLLVYRQTTPLFIALKISK